MTVDPKSYNPMLFVILTPKLDMDSLQDVIEV